MAVQPESSNNEIEWLFNDAIVRKLLSGEIILHICSLSLKQIIKVKQVKLKYMQVIFGHKWFGFLMTACKPTLKHLVKKTRISAGLEAGFWTSIRFDHLIRESFQILSNDGIFSAH